MCIGIVFVLCVIASRTGIVATKEMNRFACFDDGPKKSSFNKNRKEGRPVPSKHRDSFRLSIKGMCGEYDLKKVKVLTGYFITEGVSPRRDVD
jgi:hypothetical protein